MHGRLFFLCASCICACFLVLHLPLQQASFCAGVNISKLISLSYSLIVNIFAVSATRVNFTLYFVEHQKVPTGYFTTK